MCRCVQAHPNIECPLWMLSPDRGTGVRPSFAPPKDSSIDGGTAPAVLVFVAEGVAGSGRKHVHTTNGVCHRSVRGAHPTQRRANLRPAENVRRRKSVQVKQVMMNLKHTLTKTLALASLLALMSLRAFAFDVNISSFQIF